MNIFISSLAGSLATCFCFYFLRDKKFDLKNFFWVIYFVVLAIAIYLFAAKVIHRINNPKVWDFTAFYLYGKVAASGHNFYQPEYFHQVYHTLQLPGSFYDQLSKEVLDVGFPYPPPTILYFAPLGFLSYDTALVCWSIFNLFFAAGCIYLVYDQFFRADKLNGLILVASLFLLFPPVKTTIDYSQTNFILLFYLLLIKKHSDKKMSGIWLALAIFTKPYMIIFGLFLLLKKNWGAIIYFIITAIAICGLTMLLFGKSPFVSYIFDNPSQRIPATVFSEDLNQSLHAVLLRAGIVTIDKPLTYLYFVIGILLFTAVYLFFLLKRKLYDYILAVLLLVALLLYPGTLNFYGVLLLFIVYQFFEEGNQLGINPYLNFFIIGVFYCLSSFYLFSDICLLLFIIVLKSLIRTPMVVPAISKNR
jgi:hypothetical protein